MAGKEISPEKGLLRKPATIKRFKYLPLDSEMKKQTNIAIKKYIKVLTRFMKLIKKIMLKIWQKKLKVKKQQT